MRRIKIFIQFVMKVTENRDHMFKYILKICKIIEQMEGVRKRIGVKVLTYGFGLYWDWNHFQT